MIAESSLRERKKQQTREALETAAWRLFTRKGYDATTVDGIAEAAGVAPRTFFRYFESKEAVLFGGWRDEVEDLRQRLLARPADEPPLVALRSVLLSFSDRFEADRVVHLQRARIAAASPHAGTFRRTVLIPSWEDALTESLATVMGVDPLVDLRPRLFAGVAVAAVNSAAAVWLANDGRGSFIDLVGAAFDQLTLA